MSELIDLLNKIKTNIAKLMDLTENNLIIWSRNASNNGFIANERINDKKLNILISIRPKPNNIMESMYTEQYDLKINNILVIVEQTELKSLIQIIKRKVELAEIKSIISLTDKLFEEKEKPINSENYTYRAYFRIYEYRSEFKFYDHYTKKCIPDDGEFIYSEGHTAKQAWANLIGNYYTIRKPHNALLGDYFTKIIPLLIENKGGFPDNKQISIIDTPKFNEDGTFVHSFNNSNIIIDFGVTIYTL